MNPGPVEEGGKVAGAIVESLRAQPITLALVVLNIVFVAIVFQSAREARNLMGIMIENSAKAQDLLSKCVVPRP